VQHAFTSAPHCAARRQQVDEQGRPRVLPISGGGCDRSRDPLHNLLTHPLDVLFASAFWVSSPWMFWPVAAVLALVLGAAERRLGTLRAVLVFLGGHLGATAATVAAIAVGVGNGWVPSSLAYAVDVGPSYGLAAVGAVLVARTRDARRRHVAAVLLLGALALVLVIDRTFTDVGHLVAALLGLSAMRILVAARGVGARHAAGGRRPDGGAELPPILTRASWSSRTPPSASGTTSGGACPRTGNATPRLGSPAGRRGAGGRRGRRAAARARRSGPNR
jgi:hypothetical protein